MISNNICDKADDNKTDDKKSDELIFSIDVSLEQSASFKGQYSSVTMIPFSAKTEGKYFTGKTIFNGCDTQISDKNGFSLSARYMLLGQDYTGQDCSVFIENTGRSLENCIPKIITNSQALAFLESAELYSVVLPSPDGMCVTVKIFAKKL